MSGPPGPHPAAPGYRHYLARLLPEAAAHVIWEELSCVASPQVANKVLERAHASAATTIMHLPRAERTRPFLEQDLRQASEGILGADATTQWLARVVLTLR